MPWAKIFQADSRVMPELDDDSIDLVITSPPYWHIKDYGVTGQIGYGQSLHEYLRDLYRVWKEVYRVLRPGRRLCVNIGDQFARSVIYGRYKVIPLHAEVIAQAEQIGFDYMGAIIWQKRTTMNTTGGAVVMGSFPYPPNGIVEIDYEFILIFKKPGKSTRVDKSIKEISRLTKEEWKTYFTGHWHFGGARQIEHEAVFPPELPYRLIRMFSFVGETVLDPFAGSGTTLEQALRLERNAVGYEIHPRFVEQIRARLHRLREEHPLFPISVDFRQRVAEDGWTPPSVEEYTPRIQDARPQVDPKRLRFGPESFYRVRAIEGVDLILDTGLRVGLLGVEITDPVGYRSYVKRFLRGKQVFLKFDQPEKTARQNHVRAYVYLKNRIFVNTYVLKSGLGKPSQEEHRLRNKFLCIWKERDGQGVDSQHGNEPLGTE